MNLTSFRLAGCTLVAWAAWAMPLGAESWRMQYFYDQNDSYLSIVDLQFPSASRGVAVGSISGKRARSVAVVTSDGGANWALVPIEEPPLSLFFLNENIGWMVTSKGLWQTTEAGRQWRHMRKPPVPVVRVYFSDEKTGFAACARKTVLATHDGGEHWTPVEAASTAPGDPKYSVYSWIEFPTPERGIITGFNLPPQRFAPTEPDWLSPEQTLGHREAPHLTLSIETIDGGKTWKPTATSAFGTVTRVRMNAKGQGLGLLEFTESFQYPSDVIRLSPGRSETAYHNKNYAISDIWLEPDGTSYLAGSLHPGVLRDVAPGKVQVLKSTDMSTWLPIQMDYRAVAKRTVLAGSGGQLWLATDTGMILKLVP